MKINIWKAKVMKINNSEKITIMAREGKIQVEKGNMLTKDWMHKLKLWLKKYLRKKRRLFCNSMHTEMKRYW